MSPQSPQKRERLTDPAPQLSCSLRTDCSGNATCCFRGDACLTLLTVCVAEAQKKSQSKLCRLCVLFFCCCCCVLCPRSALSNCRLNDELILFPTIDLDCMMSSSANRRLCRTSTRADASPLCERGAQRRGWRRGRLSARSAAADSARPRSAHFILVASVICFYPLSGTCREVSRAH